MAFGLIFGQRAGQVGRIGHAGAAEHLRQLDRILQRQLGARTDREMRRMCRIAQQHDIVEGPFLA
ncbi:hypothetical protein ACS72_00075, partial [Acinetobacter sp. VT 511]